jgi:NAD(P)H-dependent flavin oxidoreductase YrpB (nitropropane dioxygenase family)
LLRTPVCGLLGIEYPIALGGMSSVYAPDLVAAVSNTGGLGTLGATYLEPANVRDACAQIRSKSDKPFGLNFLIFELKEENFAAALAEKPAVIAFAWPRPDQDIATLIQRSHDAGAKVTFMVSGVPEAVRAAEAGADVIVAQGTEGGGHVGWQTTLTLVPMVVDAVAPLPVLGAGGIADGRGLAAALALGADGVLLGTRLLASVESPIHQNYKQAIVDSDGHDTMLTEIPDIAAAWHWPGAMSRSRRNRFIERWAGREWELRKNQAAVHAAVKEARLRGDVDEAPLAFGQDAGLIHDVLPAAEIIEQMVRQARQIIELKLQRYI